MPEYSVQYDGADPAIFEHLNHFQGRITQRVSFTKICIRLCFKGVGIPNHVYRLIAARTRFEERKLHHDTHLLILASHPVLSKKARHILRFSSGCCVSLQR